MDDLMQIPPVSFDDQNGKYRMIVPTVICDNLLLSYKAGEGLSLCSNDRQLLELLKTQILSENQKACIRYRKLLSKRNSKLTLGFTGALVIGILFVFEKDILQDGTNQWPFNIAGSLLMGSSLYYIFRNYVMIGRMRGAESLGNDLDLIVLHREIREKFQC